jgi:hypothetical protein
LAYYRSEQQAGNDDFGLRLNYAKALVASALTRADDAAGLAQRRADLDAASALLNRLPAEARQLAQAHDVSDRISAAR